MSVTVVLGAQWGDEGKGKLVDMLAGEVDVAARCAGGSNAGHTVVIGDKKYDFHLVPSGILVESCINIIGNGVVLHLPSFFKELKTLSDKGVNTKNRIFVSDRAHLLFDFHQTVDGLSEGALGSDKIGTTKKGIGPCYSDKAARTGLRVCDLYHWDGFVAGFNRLLETQFKRYGKFDVDVKKELELYKEYAEQLKPLVIDSVYYINKAHAEGKKILVEGANATLLDIDFGTYPYVTSSSPSIGGACTGLGLSPEKMKNVYGVVKAYTSRVGEGPFPTEIPGELGVRLRELGAEYGVTTGRPRRCGWLDVVAVKYTTLINGFTALNLTKLDILSEFKEIKVGVAYIHKGKKLESFPAHLSVLSEVEVEYVTLPGWNTKIDHITRWEDMPQNAKAYVEYVEKLIGVHIKWVGVGASRDHMLVR